MPSVKTLQLFLPDNSVQYFTGIIFKDPVTDIELDLKLVFK